MKGDPGSMLRRSSIPATAEERDLVKRMRAGDESAFEAFADYYLPALYRFAAARIARDKEVIGEVVQATICKAIERLDSYRGEAPLFTWLCACCRNEIAGHYRRRQTRGNVDIHDKELDGSLIAFSGGTPEDHLLESEMTDLVHLALDHLPPRYAAALQWKYLDGLSVNEIAARLQLGPKAAESLLGRARTQFRVVYQRLSGTAAPGGLSVEVAT